METEGTPAPDFKDAIKANDAWWTTMFPARAANLIVGLLANTSVTPNQVTIASTVAGLAAAACLATGKWGWMALGAILVQFSFVLDCADGQLARYKNQCSLSGAWLDTATDVIKNFAFFLGLTIGAVRISGSLTFWAWGFIAYFLSVGTMFLYATRPRELKSEYAEEDDAEIDSPVDSFYHRIKSNAFFLSFSVPDQLLLISIGALLWIPGITLIVLVLWGAPVMVFSVVRTWFRVKKLESSRRYEEQGKLD